MGMVTIHPVAILYRTGPTNKGNSNSVVRLRVISILVPENAFRLREYVIRCSYHKCRCPFFVSQLSLIKPHTKAGSYDNMASKYPSWLHDEKPAAAAGFELVQGLDSGRIAV